MLVKKIYGIGTDNKFVYFKDLIKNNNCINSKQINDIFVVYDITNCEL